MKRYLFLSFILFSFLPQIWGQTNGGTLRGTVTNEAGEPLSGATIFLPEIKAGAYTNDQGIYSVAKLPAGSFEVKVFYFGYDTITESVNISENRFTTRGFTLLEKQVYTNEIEITSQRQPGKIDRNNVDIGVNEVTAADIKLIPSLGSADLAQYLQVLPGVVFTGDQGGQLFIRGGTPIQNMVMMDQMVIYSPFHSIGLFSVFDPDYIRKVDVYSAAFPAQYGGRISSVIDLDVRNGNLSEFSGKAEFNTISAGMLLEGPIIPKKGSKAGVSYLLSARNNFIDRSSPLLYPYIQSQLDDTEGLPFNFLDLYGKLTLSDGVNTANLFGFRHTDNVNYEFPANIGWDSRGGGGNFQVLPSGAGAIVSGNFAYSNYQTSLASQADSFPRRSSIEGFNGTLQVGYIFNSVDELDFGISFLGFTTDYVFTTDFGLRPQQQASNTEASMFFNYKKVIQEKNASGKTFERAVIEPGIHIHYYNNQVGAQLEPRLRAKLNFPGLSFSAGAGLYSQNLLSAVSDRDVVNFFQGFLSAPSGVANQIRRTTLQTSWHGLFGVQAELVENLTTTVEGWYKGFTQLTNINRDAQFPSDPAFITETGEAYGVDFIVKYQTPQWYLYGTYGLARVTRTDRLNLDEPRTYPPNFDRRHNVNVVAAYQSGRFSVEDEAGRRLRPKFTDPVWEVSLRWGLGSGFPFTQTQGYFEKLNFNDNGAQTDISTQNGSLGLLLAEELNGGRLPYYHRLDLAVRRRFLFSNKVLLELSASAINAYNRQNLFYFDRERFASVFQLPIMPTLGATFRY